MVNVDILLRITGDMLPVGMFAYLKENGLLFLVKELGKDGVNPHFQGIIRMNKNSLRTKLKRTDLTSREWSVKETDNVERSVQYLCKELQTGGQVIYNEGFDTERLSRAYHEEAVQHAASKKRKRGENVLELCYDDIKKEIGHSTDGRVIGAEVLRWHIENGRRAPNAFSMQTLINTYVCYQNNKLDGSIDKLSYMELLSRLYPNVNY